MTTAQFSAIISKDDRCDRCNAKAKLLVITNSGPLTFCGHHADKVQEYVRSLGYFTTTSTKAGE